MHDFWGHVIAAIQPTIAQALAFFAYMVSESILGKTKFGSWLGLARAVIWFIVSVIFGGLARVVLAALRFKSGQKSPEKNGADNG